MKEFNFWCKENTDFGKCDNKKCGFFECGCYGYCDECVYHFMDSTILIKVIRSCKLFRPSIYERLCKTAGK